MTRSIKSRKAPEPGLVAGLALAFFSVLLVGCSGKRVLAAGDLYCIYAQSSLRVENGSAAECIPTLKGQRVIEHMKHPHWERLTFDDDPPGGGAYQP